jgi:hypothetical protein
MPKSVTLEVFVVISKTLNKPLFIWAAKATISGF